MVQSERIMGNYLKICKNVKDLFHNNKTVRVLAVPS